MSLHVDIDAYLGQRAVSDLSKRSIACHRSLLRRTTTFLTARGHHRWSTVSGADFDVFLIELTDLGLKRSTRDSFACCWRAFGAWLVDQGKVLRDPTRDLRVCDDDEVDLPPAPLSEEQVTTLLNLVPKRHVVDLRIRLHLELLYSCALRNAESVALDVSDLDLDGRTVLVREGKGGVTRMLPLLMSTLIAAGEYLALRRELLRGPDRGALLLSPQGRRLGGWFMQQWLASVSKTIGFRVHPHLLRHSIAVHLLRRGADIRHIQQFLGHADLETTKVYLRLVPSHLRDDYDKAMPVLMAMDAKVEVVNCDLKPVTQGATFG
jgi:site-specific recombinase XerD